MTATKSLVKSSLLTLGLGSALVAPVTANAQSIVYTGGGSSALQGSYKASGLSLGAIPTLIVTQPAAIPNFGTAQGLLFANVTIKDPSNTFTDAGSTPALVIYSTTNKIAILVRTDSGYGVRYAANLEHITAWGPTGTAADFTAFAPGAPGTPLALSAADSVIANYLIANVATRDSTNNYTETIYNGLSDVGADAIINNSGFGAGSPTTGGISLSGIRGATHNLLPVQTLLFLYNSANQPAGHALNVSRTMAKSLIAGISGADTSFGTGTGTAIKWGQVDPNVPAAQATVAVDAFYREQPSGTRNTELLNVQRSGTNGAANIFTENGEGYNPVTFTVTGGVQGPGTKGSLSANGTGGMLTAIDSDTAAFGYAFVTGTAAAKSTQTNVALYDGNAPFTGFNLGGGNPVPTGYANNLTTTYYTGTANGTYELWAYANQYQAAGSPQTSSANELVSYLLNSTSSTIQKVVRGLGFTPLADMGAYRVARPSQYVSGTYVYDGQLVTFDGYFQNDSTMPYYLQPVSFQNSEFGDPTVAIE